MPTNTTMAKIPARYIGEYVVRLLGSNGPYYDANGQRIANNLLSNGDTIMMPAAEVLGQSFLREQDTMLELGVGRVIKAEDKDLSPEELAAKGYEFHSGRPDFVAILPPPTETATATPTDTATPPPTPVEPTTTTPPPTPQETN